MQTASQSFSQSGCQHPRGFHFQIIIRIQFSFIRTDSEKPSQCDITVLNELRPACVSQWDLCQGPVCETQLALNQGAVRGLSLSVSCWKRDYPPPPPSPHRPRHLSAKLTRAHIGNYIHILKHTCIYRKYKKCKTCLSCVHFLIRWNKITKLHIYIYNKSACWCQVAFDCVKWDLCDVVMGYQVSQMMCTVMSVFHRVLHVTPAALCVQYLIWHLTHMI